MNRLRAITSAKPLVILGINSGTSADGLDLALIHFSIAKGIPRVKFLDGGMMPYPKTVRTALDKLIGDSTADFRQVALANMAYGKFLGQAASGFLAGQKKAVDLIASHGQTIGHFPRKEKILGVTTGVTIQLGDGNAIAAETNLPVVCDFRAADIAAGGEGAPLTPFVNQILFGAKHVSRIILNIGGIANFSYHPAGGSLPDVRGGDCGPGNVLSDLAARLLFHKPYDRDGRIARKGTPVDDVVELILAANRTRHRSAGREQFGIELFAYLVHAARRRRASHADIMASMIEASACLIGKSLQPYRTDKRLVAVYLSGGGRKNHHLAERIQEYVSPIPVMPVESLGYDGDLLEAVSFAVLGGCFIAGIPSTLPQVTGAKSGAVAGKLALPPVGKTPRKR